MTPSDFKKCIQSGKISLLYIFSGEEEYLKKEALSLLKKEIVKDPLNFEKYSGKETPFARAAESASMMPFFGDRKLILVDDADPLLKESEDIISFLKNPSPYACVVLFLKNIDRRTKFFKEAESKGAVVEFNPLYPNQLKLWASDYAKKCGKTIDDDAVNSLVDNAGGNLQDIVSELDKLALFAGDRSKITLSDVESLVVRIRSEDVFDLVNAIGAKNKAAALSLLIRLMDEGKDAYELIGLFRWQFVRLFQADELLRSGKREDEVIGHFRIPPRYAGDFISSVKRFRSKDKVECLEAILNADISVKKGLSDDKAAMETLVVSLCN